MTSPKYNSYQDYVIRDGKLIGEFEQMYIDYEDPWLQSSREKYSSERAIAINWCQSLSGNHDKLKVLELGCGLGHFSNRLAQNGFEVLGIDISSTAISKAKSLYESVSFKDGDILDFDIYDQFKPDVIIMSEITWYVLDKLEDYLAYLRVKFPGIHLIHLLTTYSLGEQSYGRDYFTNQSEILDYFNLNYLEYGETSYVERGGVRTYFLGKV